MKFYKRRIGSYIDNSHIWVVCCNLHKFTIYFNKSEYGYYFKVKKDKATISNSLQNNMKYETLEETENATCLWDFTNISKSRYDTLRKEAYYSISSKKYRYLVNAVKKTCEREDNSSLIKDFKKVLHGIGEM